MNKLVKKPVGAPTKLKDGKRVNVYLDDKTTKKAREIGGGNLSKGMRDSVEAYQIEGAGNAVVQASGAPTLNKGTASCSASPATES